VLLSLPWQRRRCLATNEKGASDVTSQLQMPLSGHQQQQQMNGVGMGADGKDGGRESDAHASGKGQRRGFAANLAD